MPAVFLKSAVHAADLPKSGKPQIAMLGRSNVGKSSLINHLAGAKSLARVSARPGLTQTINLYEFDGRYFLVDLPGYGYFRSKKLTGGEGFSAMIGEYVSESDNLKAVLLVIDARVGLTESDRHALGQLTSEEVPFTVIVNKIDKLTNSDAVVILRKLQAEFPAVKFLPHSTVNGRGLGEIRDVIERAVRGR